MTELLYQIDSYIREFNAKVVKINQNIIVLNRTAFYPKTGGLESDTGYIVKGDKKYRVVQVRIDKESGDVVHELESSPIDIKEGDEVMGILDWDRRYRLMRLHTAAHILSAIMYRDYNALITGGNIYPEYAYDDYSIEVFDRKIFEDAIAKANEIVKKNLEVKIYWLERDEAMKIPGIVKLASRLPPNVEKLRIVEIPGVDIQADGGPHVRNTQEIGEIVFIKAENKGRNRKRLYYTVKP
ncbi:Ala-tRNA(Pro) hydrolase [Ignisphaera aggregans DSM 17230]|uniref:Ala-tRNA(Pro) hydrolase n=1 Tax=Ignisphaera aggregans (strain DSM 17230 / JCM 13409 / AQ1.S1) TaxID=583356 RepID=E0SR05_IGNAA|nr:Ala-tRNA(Pro) hydrolase [Ignisphaera aggregans DSM 17230]